MTTASQPQISMPSSMSQKPGFYDDETPGESSSKGATTTHSEKQPKNKQTDGVIGAKKPTQTNSSQSSGWFGGIFGKLSMKKNTLPDDTNKHVRNN